MIRLRRDRLFPDAVRTAGITTAVVFLLLVALCAGVDLLVRHNLVASVDERLEGRIASLQRNHDPLFAGQGAHDEQDRNTDTPILAWAVGHDGTVLGTSAGAPTLPTSLHSAGATTDADVGGIAVRISGAPVDDGRVVVAESLASVSHAMTTLVIAEALFAPVLLVAVFLGALAIGYRVAGPVERARRRQLAFTADASHELRTPLAVIEAETSLALSAQRDAEAYREALQRVAGESGRLRSIVDDLLWLARFDTEPAAPHTEPVDLSLVAVAAADRFRTVAAGRDIRIRSEVHGDRPPIISAPAEWVDRLCGVLLDNACKYSPPGDVVEVHVRSDAGGVTLTVRDHGPGIPAEERPYIFDRFRRATDSTAGAGLGLAIGDAVVRATGGRWEVSETPGGGATLSVTWPRSAGGAFQRALDGAPAPGQTEPGRAPSA